MPTAHATVETITEIAAVCSLLAAATSVWAEEFRIPKYTLWMKRVQERWWVTLLLAFASYTRCYVRNLFRK